MRRLLRHLWANFIRAEYRRLFMSPWCQKHGRIKGPLLMKKVSENVREVLCPRCHPVTVS